MKICVAQTRPVKGDTTVNINNHKKLIELALEDEANMIVFPELSLTGYEPELAKELATDKDDSQFDELQTISNENNIAICAGMPLKTSNGVMIGMIIFQPKKPREVYTKQYLHADEFPFFVNGKAGTILKDHHDKVAIGICYELSVPEHSENAFKKGAEIYITSVAKTAIGVEKAFETLSAIAKKHSMTVFMSNCVGHCDNFDSAGKTAVWNNKGVLMGQLDDINEGIIIFDTETEEMIEKIISPPILSFRERN